jgi:transposase
MWVYVSDDDYPYNIFDFALNRGRDEPKYFLKDHRQVLLADAYGGHNGVVADNEITRAGCWAHNLGNEFIKSNFSNLPRRGTELVTGSR